MNRRTFLGSMAIAGGSLMFRRSLSGQPTPPAAQPASAAKQSTAVRAAAEQFLKTLGNERQGNVVFAFPRGETPGAAHFARNGPGGRGGGPGGGFGRRGGPGGPNGGRPASGPSTRPAGQAQGFDRGPRDGGGPGGGGPDGRDRGPGGGGGGFGGFIGEKWGLSVWSNFPVSDVIRPGLRMGEMATAERDAVHSLLRVVLSPMGYQKVLDIMAADQVLADQGTPYASGINAYTLALFGQPSATSPWMLQLGGHHLGLNVIFVGDKAVCAPLHTGILPARFESHGKIVRGLGHENDEAFDLVATFSAQQRNSAIIDHEISDLRCGPGKPTVTFAPEGLRGADMSEPQRAMMLELARQWVGVLNDSHTTNRLEEIRKALPETYFAWSGPTTHEPGYNGESYFRVHGPSLLIEHAPQDNQGGYRLHVHTVARDLNNDYAKQYLT